MNTRNSVVELCVYVGRDFLLTQGAGGNVSWKEDNILWIKASGTWLRDAKENDIFLPLDLNTIRDQVMSKDFKSIPQPINGDKKRPSIETWFHALLPHKFVLHVHALELLALLIRTNANEIVSRSLTTSLDWAFIEYLKPGEKLAIRIAEVLNQSPRVSLLFLENHGIVIGADSVDEIEKILFELRLQLGQAVVTVSQELHENRSEEIEAVGYSRVENESINSLATDSTLMGFVERAWAIAPDHVVFLGPKPEIVADMQGLSTLVSASKTRPKLVFVRDVGVFTDGPIDNSTLDHLLAYYEILIRQAPDAEFRIFTEAEIGELLDWDAEKYRQGLRK